MKKNKFDITCILYKTAFRLTPFLSWKVKIMDRHLCGCPFCSVESVTDRQLEDLAVTLRDAESLPSVRPQLDPVSGLTHNPVTSGPGYRVWLHAAATLVLAVGLLWAMFFAGPGQVPTHEEEKVVVQSVKLHSKTAKYFIFSSNNPDKLIVWTQAKREENGG